MAYNRKNKLRLIIAIQNITLEHTRKGVSQDWVYKNLIHPRYHVSERTYYNYLATPAKQELKALETKNESIPSPTGK
jgi:hypothetical protein